VQQSPTIEVYRRGLTWLTGEEESHIVFICLPWIVLTLHLSPTFSLVSMMSQVRCASIGLGSMTLKARRDADNNCKMSDYLQTLPSEELNKGIAAWLHRCQAVNIYQEVILLRCCRDEDQTPYRCQNHSVPVVRQLAACTCARFYTAVDPGARL
jgi:hypothetical protein